MIQAVVLFTGDIVVLNLFRIGLSENVLSASCDRAMWLFRRLLPGRQRISF